MLSSRRRVSCSSSWRSASKSMRMVPGGAPRQRRNTKSETRNPKRKKLGKQELTTESQRTQRPSQRKDKGIGFLSVKSSVSSVTLWLVPSALHRRLDRLEQLAHADAEAEGNLVERLDRGGVLTQLDLREVAERHAGALRHLGQCEPQRLAAI